jgi:O-antigen/teichoic acid export membrane protein
MEKTDSTLRDRLIKGMSSQMFSQAVQIVIRLCEVPLFLSFWGAEPYGEWLMISAIPTYLAMGDGGFTQTARRDITIRASAGDRDGACSTYQSIWTLLVVLSLFILVLLTFIACFAPLNEWLNLSNMSRSEAGIVLLVLGAMVLVGFQGELFNSGFWASGKYPLSMFYNALNQLISFGGMALAIVLKGGPIQVAIGYLVGKIIGTVILLVAQGNTCPWLKLGFRHASFKEIKRLITPSLASLAFPVGNALNVQGVRLAIGFVLGPSVLAIFVPLRTLSNFVDVPCQIVRAITEPEMSISYGAGDKPTYRRLFIDSVRISFWSCFLFGLLLIPLGKIIFGIWTAHKVTFDLPTYILLVIAAILDSIWVVALMVSFSTNRHGRNAIYYMVIYGFIFVVLAYFGSKYMGMVGPALALIIVEIAMNILVLVEALKMTGISAKNMLSSFIKPPIAELSTELKKILLMYPVKNT